MSVRASLISFFLRRTLKKQMATFEDPADVRQSQSRPGAKMPKDLTIAPVDAGGVPAEWITPSASADGEALYGYDHGGRRLVRADLASGEVETIAQGDEPNRPELPDEEECPQALCEMIERAWEADPHRRPSFSDCVTTLQRVRRGIGGRPGATHSAPIAPTARGCVGSG